MDPDLGQAELTLSGKDGCFSGPLGLLQDQEKYPRARGPSTSCILGVRRYPEEGLGHGRGSTRLKPNEAALRRLPRAH